MDKEKNIKTELERLHELHTKSQIFNDIRPNEKSKNIMNSLQEYIQTELESIDVEHKYKELDREYRKWSKLRQILSVQSILSPDKFPMCPVCLTENISHTFSPCGHTICAKCVGKISRNCPICRQEIKQKLKLYFT